MSEPHDPATPEDDDAAAAALPPFDLPAFDAEPDPVTDPIALALGSQGPGDDDAVPLPEPLLGSDEGDDGLALDAGSDADSGGRSPFLAGLAARAAAPAAPAMPVFGEDDGPSAALDDEPAMAFGAADAEPAPMSFDDAEDPAPVSFDDPADSGPMGFGDADAGDGMSMGGFDDGQAMPDAAMMADPPPAPPVMPSNGAALVASDPGSRRVWRELRYVQVDEVKPVVEVPPPFVDERGRTIRKYLFERSFDIVETPPEPEPEPEPEPIPEPVEVIAEEPPPPVFSEEELAGARAAGYADGEAAGREAATGALEARIAELLQSLGEGLPELIADRDRVVTAVTHEAARLAHAMIRRLVPEIARRYRVEEIEAVVIDSLDKALDQPRIIIRTPADITGYLSERLESTARRYGFAGRVVTLSDPSLGPADVKVEWGDGGAERCVERAWADIDTIVSRVIEKLEQVAPPAEIPPGSPEDTIGSAA